MKIAAPEQTLKKPRKSLWRRLLLALPAVALLLWLARTLLWQVGFGLPGYADFHLHQGKYQSIIAKVRAQPLAPGATAHQWLNGCSVDITRRPSGSYAVTITTVDWDHGGVYGSVSSDTPLTVHASDNYPAFQSVDNPGDMPFADRKIVGQGGH